MVETIEIIAYIIIAVIGVFFGSFISWIVGKLQRMKEARNIDHEKIFESLTKDGKVYYDQPATTGPARKIIFSLKEDPKTGKKILHQDFENYVPPKTEKKKSPKKNKKTIVKKEKPSPKPIARNYNKMFGGKSSK